MAWISLPSKLKGRPSPVTISKTQESRFSSSSLWLSLGVHGLVVFLGIAVHFYRPSSEKKLMDFVVEIPDKPVLAQSPPPLQIENKPLPPVQPPQKAVFGVQKRALEARADDSSAPTIKIGNTTAKEADMESLKEDDPEALPIPADEVFISAMPRLLSEFIVPYPEEARRRGVEGAVIMEILIDREGLVRQVSLVSGPEESLNQAAQTAARNLRFRAAEVQGEPVAAKIRYTYRFELEN